MTTYSQETSKKRIEWIDLAKGICMILVILGHSDSLMKWLGLYEESMCLTYVRMPFYFILSGLFFKDYGSFSFFLKKKINHLLIPYIIFITLHFTTPLPFDSVWFLYCLFLVNIFGYFTLQIAKALHTEKTIMGGGNLLTIILSIAISYTGYTFRESSVALIPIPSLHLRWLTSAMVALPFFLFGYNLRNITRFLTLPVNASRDFLLFVVGIVAIVFVGYIYNWGLVSYYSMYYDLPLYLMLLIGLVGSIGFLSLARYINYAPIISYIGRYSIIVLITHKVFILVFGHFIRGFEGSELLVFILVMLAEIPTIYVCKRYFPYIFAQKELLK